MNNPLFNALGGSKVPANPLSNMMQAFQQFKSQFQGDPQQEVMKLVQSGQITQHQLNELQSLATQFQQFIK